MVAFQDWCREVDATTEGKIALSNMRYDAVMGRVDRATRLSFRAALETEPTPAATPELTIRKVAQTDPQTFCCKGPASRAEQCSRIATDLDLAHENIDLLARGWQVEDHVPDEYLEEMELSLDGLAVGNIPTAPRSFAWVTKTAELSELRRGIDPPQVGVAARDRCGLLHHPQIAAVRLVEIVYPATGVELSLHGPYVSRRRPLRRLYVEGPRGELGNSA